MGAAVSDSHRQRQARRPQERSKLCPIQADDKEAYESISSIETASGYVDVRLTNKNVTYHQQLATFVEKNEVLYKEITRGSKRFQAHKVDEVNELYEMGRRVRTQATDSLSSMRLGGSSSQR